MAKQNIFDPLIRSGHALWNSLVEPPAAIQEADRRRQSRLLATLLLATLVVTVIIAVAWMLLLSISLLPASYLGFALLLVAFALNRAGHYKAAAVLTVAIVCVIPFIFVMSRPLNLLALEFLMVGVLLSSIFLSPRTTSIVAVANTLGLLVLPVLVPQLSAADDLLNTLAVNALGSLLIILAMNHRNSMEKDRQTALAASEAQLRYQAELLETISDAVISVDMNFIVRSWNRAAETIYGWKAEEMIGNSTRQFFQTQYPGAKAEEVLAKLLEQGYWRGEIIQTSKQGTPIHILASVTLLKDSVVNPIGLVSVNRDITLRKQAEARLRESEARYRRISELTSDYAYAFRVDGTAEPTLEWATEAITRVTGYSVEDMRQLADWDRTVHPDDLEILREQRRKLFAREKPGESQFRIVTREGDIRWLSNLLVAEWDENQQRIIRVYGAARDISERKRIEDALRSSESKYRLLVEQAADGIFISDQKGNYLEVNSRGCQMLGYSRGELLRLNVWDVVLEAGETIAPQNLEDLLAGKTLLNELRMRRKDGVNIPVEVSNRMLVDGTIQSIVRDITERKRADVILQENEKRFRALVENSTDAIALLGEDGIILYGSPSTTALLGYPLENFVGRNAFELIHTEDHEIVMGGLAESMQRPGQGIKVHARVLHQDGTWRFLEGVFTNLLSDSSVRAIVTNYRDATTRKLAEEAVRVSEERYRIISEMMGDYIYSVRVLPGDDYKTTLEWAAGAIERITGHTVEEALAGIDWNSLIHPDDRELVNARRQILLSGKKDISEFRMVNKRGETYWLRAYNQPIWDDDEGRVVRIYAAVQDITERKMALDALSTSEKRFRTLVENSGDVTLLVAPDSTIIYTGPSTQKILGYSEEEFIGRKTLEFIHPDDLERVSKSGQRVFENPGVPLPEAYRVRHKDGSYRWVEGTATNLFHDPAIQAIVANNRDITERKEAEQGLRRAYDELEIRVAERTAELAQERNLLRALLDIIPDYIYVKNTESRYVVDNLSHTHVLGRQTPDEIVGSWDFDLFPPELAAQYYADEQAIIRSGQPMLQREEPSVSSDGRSMWVSTTKVPFRDEQGNIIGVVGITRDITEQKQIEETLRKSEELYRTLVRNLPNVIVNMFDKDLRYTVIEGAALHRHGYQRPMLEGKTIWESLPSDRAALYEPLYRAALAGESKSLEVERDGFTYQMMIVPVKDENGEVFAGMAVSEDITERKRIEVTLAGERNLLRTMMDNIPDFIYVKDTQSRFLLNNMPHMRFLGVANPGEAAGKSDFDYFPKELAEQYYADEQLIIQSGKPLLDHEQKSQDWDGRTIWASSTKVPLRDTEGRINGLVGITRDITERKETEAKLQYQANLLANVKDAVIASDDHFILTSWNPAAEKMYGWKAEEVIGKGGQEVLRSEFIGVERAEAISGLVQTGLLHGEMIQYGKDDQPIYIEGDVIALKDESGRTTGYLSVNRDITERKRAQDEIKNLNTNLARRAFELEAANKELEAFSYSVSHDLRAPLRAMDGFSRILLSDYTAQLPADAQRYLQLIRDNAQQMGELITGLLDLSHLGRKSLQKQSVHPTDLVRRAMEDLITEWEHREIELIVGDLPPCQADPILLKQVFLNLLQNALKFTRQREVTRIEIGSQQTDHERVYYVKDNGIGFDMRFVHKLFGVFQRMHRAEDFEGVGVGLATVQRIIHRHGGRAWAEGEVDKGANFYFTLGDENGRQ